VFCCDLTQQHPSTTTTTITTTAAVKKKELQKMPHKSSLARVLFTAHYIDISHGLHINEQQIKEK